VREADGLDTSDPQPRAWRFWFGLTLLSVAVVPSLIVPFLKT